MKLACLFLGIAMILISIGIFIYDEIQDYIRHKPNNKRLEKGEL